jgi:hypothetical protein
MSNLCIEQVSLRQDIHFVKGLDLQLEQNSFPEANRKISQMLRMPILNYIKLVR